MTTTEYARGEEPSGRCGFTLVEVIVAVVILTVGLLGLAGTTGWVVRQTAFADATTERAAARQSVIEKIRARPVDGVIDGSEISGRFTMTWSVVESTADYKTIRVVTEGPGLRSGGTGLPTMGSEVADTFSFQMIDLKR